MGFGMSEKNQMGNHTGSNNYGGSADQGASGDANQMPGSPLGSETSPFGSHSDSDRNPLESGGNLGPNVDYEIILKIWRKFRNWKEKIDSIPYSFLKFIEISKFPLEIKTDSSSAYIEHRQ
jgi:hypothetical protein